MKVQGSLDLVQTNLDFYLRLTSTSKHRKVDDLRSFYYNQFLDDAKKGLKSMASSKQEVAEVKVVEEDVTPIGASSFLSMVQESREELAENTANSFLDTVQNMRARTDVDIKPVGGLCLDDIIEDSGYVVEDNIEVHGTMLDEYVAIVKPADVSSNDTYDEYEEFDEHEEVEVVTTEEIHGTILDDYEIIESTQVSVLEYKPVFHEDVHGLILDDYEVVEKVTDVYVEEDNGLVYEDDESDDGLVYDEEEVDFSYEDEEFEEEYEEVVVEESPVPDNVIPISDRIRLVEPQEVIPPTVREYLKKHPGCKISEVEKHYPKKVVQKELTMGKIYKKGDKLFI